jgi:hypothetical protein
MIQKKVLKKRVLITLDEGIVGLAKKSNINLSNTCNQLLSNLLVKGMNNSLDNIHNSFDQVLKSGSHGIGSSNPSVGAL